jgi:RNA polymerase sigma factor (sigma-70 family)
LPAATVGMLVWALTYVGLGEAKPFIWLLPLVSAVVCLRPASPSDRPLRVGRSRPVGERVERSRNPFGTAGVTSAVVVDMWTGMADEEERLAALWSEHISALVLYALRRCPTRADAFDVVSEVYLVAWRRIGDVPAGADARPWLFGVARNVVKNVERGERRRSRLSERLMREVDVVVLDDTERSDDAMRLHAAINALETDSRELLMLVSFDGLTIAEAASALGIPAGTARVRLHRVRALLRKKLERDGGLGHVHAVTQPRVAARSLEVN